MATRDIWPKGIKPRGSGLQIKIWGKGGKLRHSETHTCDPLKPASLAAAIKRREYLLAKQRLGQSLVDGDGGIESFREVAGRWLGSLQIDHETIRGYWRIMNQHWIPAYGSQPLSDITQASIIEKLAATGTTVKTQKNIVGPLRQVLKHGGCNPNPANNITWPRTKTQKRKTQRYLPAERAKIVSRLQKLTDKATLLGREKPTQKNESAAHWACQANVYFSLLFATGLRPGEALGLLWTDYDGEYIDVSKQYTRGKAKDTTKTGHDRQVYVPKWVRPLLDSHPTRFQEGPLFVGKRRGPLKDTKRLNPFWKQAHVKERLPLRDPYVCRHSRASEMLSQGVEPVYAAEQLGHTVQTFHNEYASFVKEYRGKRDMSRFEGVTELLPHKTEGLNI